MSPEDRSAPPGSRLDRGDGEETFQRLLAGLELRDGFALFLVVSDSFPVLLEVQQRLVERHRAQGATLRLLTPTTVEEQGLMVARLVDLAEEGKPTSTGGSSAPASVVLWPQVAQERWEETWRTVCKVLNERREWFRHSWPHALIIFGSEAAHDILRDEAVDLWSIRSGTYRIGQLGASAATVPPTDETICVPSSLDLTSDAPHGVSLADRLMASEEPADRELGLSTLLRQAREARQRGDNRAARIMASRALWHPDHLPSLDSEALTVLGSVYLSEGLLDEAERALKRSMVIDLGLGHESHLSTDYYYLGRIEKERGRLDEAERWVRMAIDIDEKLRDRSSLWADYEFMSDVARCRGHLDEEERWLRKAIDISYSAAQSIAQYNRLYIIEVARGRLTEAERWLLKAIGNVERLGDWVNATRLYENMADLLEKMGRLKEARWWLDEAEALKR